MTKSYEMFSPANRGRVESNHIEIEELITYKNGEYVRGLATIPRLEKIKNTLKSLNLDEENFLL